MLVLSRRRNEGITIKHEDLTIRIVVVGNDGHHVRLGISAPPEYQIHRDEVWEEIDDENSR
jgi:carbon storage regulator